MSLIVVSSSSAVVLKGNYDMLNQDIGAVEGRYIPKFDASGNNAPFRLDASGNNTPMRLDASGNSIPSRSVFPDNKYFS